MTDTSTFGEASPSGDGLVPYDTFGARLAIVRATMHWNVAAAAKACDQTASSWTNWERGGTCATQDSVAKAVSRVTPFSYTWLIAGGPLVRSRCFSRSEQDLVMAPFEFDAAA